VQLTIDDFELNHNTKLISPNIKMKKMGIKKSFEVQCESICAVEDSRLQNFCSRQAKLKKAGRIQQNCFTSRIQ